MLQIVHSSKPQKKSMYQLSFEQDCDRVLNEVIEEMGAKYQIIEAARPGFRERLRKQIFQKQA